MQIDSIESRWAKAYYSEISDLDKKSIYEELYSQTNKLVLQFPQSAEPLIWKGIL